MILLFKVGGHGTVRRFPVVRQLSTTLLFCYDFSTYQSLVILQIHYMVVLDCETYAKKLKQLNFSETGRFIFMEERIVVWLKRSIKPLKKQARKMARLSTSVSRCLLRHLCTNNLTYTYKKTCSDDWNIGESLTRYNWKRTWRKVVCNE